MLPRLFGLVAVMAAMFCTPTAARADFMRFTANLSGLFESPQNASPATGFTIVNFDTSAHTMRVQVTFSGLLGTTTASHIHSATAVAGTGTVGVATELPSFTGFPLGVTSGTYDNTFNTALTAFYNPSFLTNNGGTAASAETAFFAGMMQGKAYLNIHSTSFPGGEIRGFLQASPVPAPPGLILLSSGALMMLLSSGLRTVRRRMA